MQKQTKNNKPLFLVDNIHGRVLDVVKVGTHDGDIDTSRRDTLGHLSSASVPRFRVVNGGILYVLVFASLQHSNSFVKDHADLGLVQGSSSTSDADGLIWNAICIKVIKLKMILLIIN